MLAQTHLLETARLVSIFNKNKFDSCHTRRRQRRAVGRSVWGIIYHPVWNRVIFFAKNRGGSCPPALYGPATKTTTITSAKTTREPHI